MTPLKWIERYDIPGTPHEGWAVIHIDSRGFLGVVSSHGNYAFNWRDFEGDFKAFLIGLDWDYLHEKLVFGQHRTRFVYDAKATQAAVAERIRGALANGSLTETDASDETLLLEERLHVEDNFEFWAEHETRLQNPWALRHTMHEPTCRTFCEKVWPRFIELLKSGASTPILPPG